MQRLARWLHESEQNRQYDSVFCDTRHCGMNGMIPRVLIAASMQFFDTLHSFLYENK